MHSIHLAKAGLGFSAAHFLATHEKCSRLHGHNYRVRVGVKGKPDANGMVIDFRALTQEVARACSEMDHKVIVPGEAPDIQTSIEGGEIRITLPDREYLLPLDDVAVIPVEASTAEALAEYLYRRLSGPIVGLAYVEVEESPGSVARYGEG
jgi:6-pyruvoyltetrahydropterin/6-carboxytetrahydropterin synthase